MWKGIIHKWTSFFEENFLPLIQDDINNGVDLLNHIFLVENEKYQEFLDQQE